MTGANSNIGKAIALALGTAGAKVAVNCLENFDVMDFSTGPTVFDDCAMTDDLSFMYGDQPGANASSL